MDHLTKCEETLLNIYFFKRYLWTGTISAN